MKKIVCILVLMSLLLSGCDIHGSGQRQYTAIDLTLFDTVTTVLGCWDSEEAFEQLSAEIFDDLRYYHQLFDIYHEYEGINNLKTVNDNAGIAPVKVDGAIIELLKDCRHYYRMTDGKVNVAMGSVLKLWHEARETEQLPEQQQLLQAAEHTDIDSIVIDEQASTVYLSDGAVQLDVGAVAKGWASQRVAESAPTGLLISVGGNVCATGPKQETEEPWIVGVQNPEGGAYLQKLKIDGGSVVTSGDYQRYFVVDGTMYHHIIDPQTLTPANLWRSVTVICSDSALADALSTALFLMPYEQGNALVQSVGAEAMWFNAQGEYFYSAGFEAYIQE